MLYIKLSNILIIICFSLLLIFKGYNKLENRIHINKLENIIYNGEKNETKYIGYVKIDRLNIKRGIVNGISDLILDANDVGISFNGNIVLAGHSIENVFGKLHSIKLNDMIELYLYNEKYEYIVDSIKIVDKKEVEELSSDLNLITCMYNPDKRLIVGAKKNT